MIILKNSKLLILRARFFLLFQKQNISVASGWSGYFLNQSFVDKQSFELEEIGQNADSGQKFLRWPVIYFPILTVEASNQNDGKIDESLKIFGRTSNLRLVDECLTTVLAYVTVVWLEKIHL